MAREIKFRAWDTERKEWKSRLNVYVNGAGEKIWQFGNDFEVYSEVALSQCTGLKDEKGVEIYEGDLFGLMGGDKDRPHEYEVFGEVYFDTDFAGFCVKYPNGGWTTLGEHLLEKQNHREVIGNIYENPELIKG